MRQRRWVEYLKDYDFMSYHLGKANVIADALSRRTHVMVSLTVKEWTMLEDLVECRPKTISRDNWCWVANLLVRPRLIEIIMACQQLDPFVQATLDKLEIGEVSHFFVGAYGEL